MPRGPYDPQGDPPKNSWWVSVSREDWPDKVAEQAPRMRPKVGYFSPARSIVDDEVGLRHRAEDARVRAL